MARQEKLARVSLRFCRDTIKYQLFRRATRFRRRPRQVTLSRQFLHMCPMIMMLGRHSMHYLTQLLICPTQCSVHYLPSTDTFRH